MAEQGTNWLHIKRDYVLPHFDKEGRPEYWSLDELAKRYKVSRSTLGDHAAKESWLAERETIQQRVYTESIKKYEEELSVVLAAGDRDAAILAGEMLAFLRRRFRLLDEDVDAKALAVKTWARPIMEILQVLHEAVGVGQLPKPEVK